MKKKMIEKLNRTELTEEEIQAAIYSKANDKTYNRIVKIVRLFTHRLTKIEITGLENIPKTGGVILALNHTSPLDPVIVGAEIAKHRPVRALAKDILFTKPFIGYFMKKMNHIPVLRNGPRAGDSLIVAVERVKNGELIALYPEGTVPEDLTKIGTLKSGTVRLALQTGALIIPVVQTGPQHIFPKQKKIPFKSLFKAFVKRPKTIVHIGEPLKHEFLTGNVQEKSRQDKVKLINNHLADTLANMMKELKHEENGS